ncbi:MAG: HEPN domain-containing protein [Candidatus Eisenbacteria bacterium]|nr:HEPN domain-containing protein [Candidatus Eisenbacteria bacterium]
MNPFESCIRNGRLKPAEVDDATLAREIQTGIDELVKARNCFHNGRFEETVVQAYFAMYRAAKSLLLAGGYRDSNLYSLTAGVQRLYVEPGALDPKLVDLLRIAKDQKDLVHEGARCGKKDTRVILAAAERLVARAVELLALPNVSPPEPNEDVSSS